MKTYFVIYSQHDGTHEVRILGVYEDREKAYEAKEAAISNSGFFELIYLDEVYM